MVVLKLLSRLPRIVRWGGVLLLVLVLGALAAGKAGHLRLANRVLNKARTLHFRWTTVEECVDGPAGLKLCVASDMAKLPGWGPVPAEPWLFQRSSRTIKLDAARNETVAFQLVLKGRGVSPARQVSIQVSDLTGPGGARIHADRWVSRFLAQYVWVDPGGYTWGPESEVLPWPDFYPDALVPFRTHCLLAKAGLARSREVLSSFTVPGRQSENQAMWIDIHVPHHQPPGTYSGEVVLRSAGAVTRLPLRLRVHRPVLPQRPTFHAVGELYSAYEAEGVGRDISRPAWQRMAHCYQQLAHRHRTVFVERLWERSVFNGREENPTEADWVPFDKAFGPALGGKLFTRAMGYAGPGEGVPVAIWRTPWGQFHNGRLKGPLPPDRVARYQRLAQVYWNHLEQRGWTAALQFAYLLDEVEGGTDIDSDHRVSTGATRPDHTAYVRMAHLQMRRLQQALDQGAGPGRIHLMWTSHANPKVWAGKPGLDLAGIIRLWVPNAAAASTEFLAGRAKKGEQVWFYHAGHPSIGIHSINASGVEMRTWGVAAARYGFTGQFMWAVNLGNPKAPYLKPSYKNGDDRFGNGTLVYPGARLPSVGRPAISEPVPSIRLKMWRRGLQDAELVLLARKAGEGAQARKLVRQIMPRALDEASGEPSWPTDSGAWNRFRVRLLQLAARESR